MKLTALALVREPYNIIKIATIKVYPPSSHTKLSHQIYSRKENGKQSNLGDIPWELRNEMALMLHADPDA